jgi:uncharacterized protein involved in tellurium resistance
MAAPNVDLVLVIDASASMKPCFDGLRNHLTKILQPLQGHVSNVEFCVLAQSVGMRGRRLVHDHRFLGCSGAEALELLYKSNPTQGAPRASFFTTDAQRVTRLLADLKPDGNEDLLLALDIAADLPFASVGNTCRVIALFSDEPIEAGAVDTGRLDKIPALIDKLQQRRIKLFAAVPESPAALELSQANRSEVEFVEGGDGLKGVDFSELLRQMGKSISVMSLQSTGEEHYERALFGQDRWDAEVSVSAAERDLVLAVGERARFNAATPLTDVRVQLRWTRPIDLDLHAFFVRRDGRDGHVYFQCRSAHGVSLDHDAGVRDRGGDNVETLVVDDLRPISSIVFATKIFGDGDRYSDYDAAVEITPSDGRKFTVPLTAQRRGRWCAIARIDCTASSATVVNLNEVSDGEPEACRGRAPGSVPVTPRSLAPVVTDEPAPLDTPTRSSRPSAVQQLSEATPAPHIQGPAPSDTSADAAVERSATEAGICVTLVIVKRSGDSVEAIFDVANESAINFNELALQIRFFDKQGHFADETSIGGRLQPGGRRRDSGMGGILIEELGRIELSGIYGFSEVNGKYLSGLVQQREFSSRLAAVRLRVDTKTSSFRFEARHADALSALLE